MVDRFVNSVLGLDVLETVGGTWTGLPIGKMPSEGCFGHFKWWGLLYKGIPFSM